MLYKHTKRNPYSIFHCRIIILCRLDLLFCGKSRLCKFVIVCGGIQLGIPLAQVYFARTKPSTYFLFAFQVGVDKNEQRFRLHAPMGHLYMHKFGSKIWPLPPYVLGTFFLLNASDFILVKTQRYFSRKPEKKRCATINFWFLQTIGKNMEITYNCNSV